MLIPESNALDNPFHVDGDRPATEFETANWLLDDNPTMRTNFTVYDRVFPDGQREICVTKSVLIRNAPSFPQKRAMRGESDKREANHADSVKRAKQAVRQRCKTIGADRMITLTYKENMQDMARLKADWKKFVRRFSKCKGFDYVATIERQERGAFHLHVAVRGRQVYQLVRSIWYSVVGKTADGKPNGQCDVRDPHKFGFNKKGRHKLAAYLAKYIGKDLDDQELNKKRYWSSKGIQIPEKDWYSLPYGSTFEDACVHALTLAVATNNDDMSLFVNNRLGVVWIATAPPG